MADSGFTFPQVSRAMSDSIYGCVQGAEYNTKQQLWLVPCDQMLNISFNFGGVNFPIHPLDTVSADFNMTDSKGNSACIGTVCVQLSTYCVSAYCHAVSTNYLSIQSLGFI